MLLAHISFSLGLIALIMGLGLYLWSVRAEPGCGIGLAKAIGIIVIILAILELVGTIYSSMRWKHLQHEIKDTVSVVAPSSAAPAAQPMSLNNLPDNNTNASVSAAASANAPAAQ